MPVGGSFRRRVEERVGHHRLFKDKVYTAADWEYQKSWKRYVPHPITSFRVFWGFAYVVICLTLVAVGICLYHAWLEREGAPSFWNKNLTLWQPFSLSSFCLALLLVHRTTASYNRWWEARTVWGGILNVTRNLVRQAASPWGFPPQEEDQLEMFSRWVIALPYLLKAHLKLESAKPDLEDLLLPEELDYLFQAKQPCLRCAQVLSTLVGNAMPGIEYQQSRVWIDEQITLYVNYVGACERIIKTAIPIAFTRHLTRFLLVWLVLLPFCLWPIVGWATPAVEAVLSFLLLGTENIGIQVEEPFCILAMGAFCTSCENSVIDIMEAHAGALHFVRGMKNSRQAPGFRRFEPERRDEDCDVAIEVVDVVQPSFANGNGVDVSSNSKSSSGTSNPCHSKSNNVNSLPGVQPKGKVTIKTML